MGGVHEEKTFYTECLAFHFHVLRLYGGKAEMKSEYAQGKLQVFQTIC